MQTVHEANELCKSLGMPEIKNKWDILERMLLVFRNETEEGILAFFFPVSVLDFLIQPGFRINGQPIITCLSKQNQIFIDQIVVNSVQKRKQYGFLWMRGIHIAFVVIFLYNKRKDSAKICRRCL